MGRAEWGREGISHLKWLCCHPVAPAKCTVILRAAQPDFRAHSPRRARESGGLARSEGSRRRNGGNLDPLFSCFGYDVNKAI
jgi:hypothetical protein